MADLIPLSCQPVKYFADMPYLFIATLLSTSYIIQGDLFHLATKEIYCFVIFLLCKLPEADVELCRCQITGRGQDHILHKCSVIHF